MTLVSLRRFVGVETGGESDSWSELDTEAGGGMRERETDEGMGGKGRAEVEREVAFELSHSNDSSSSLLSLFFSKCSPWRSAEDRERTIDSGSEKEVKRRPGAARDEGLGRGVVRIRFSSEWVRVKAWVGGEEGEDEGFEEVEEWSGEYGTEELSKALISLISLESFTSMASSSSFSPSMRSRSGSSSPLSLSGKLERIRSSSLFDFSKDSSMTSPSIAISSLSTEEERGGGSESEGVREGEDDDERCVGGEEEISREIRSWEWSFGTVDGKKDGAAFGSDVVVEEGAGEMEIDDTRDDCLWVKRWLPRAEIEGTLNLEGKSEEAIAKDEGTQEAGVGSEGRGERKANLLGR